MIWDLHKASSMSQTYHSVALEPTVPGAQALCCGSVVLLNQAWDEGLVMSNEASLLEVHELLLRNRRFQQTGMTDGSGVACLIGVVLSSPAAQK